MIHGKVSCLMATHGRWSRVCEAVSMFLEQDYGNASLTILNNHPEPLSVPSHWPSSVKVVNEPGHPTLGHCRQRLLDFADGEFLRTWDDDDLYLPWTLSQGICHIGGSEAWKPLRSWWFDGNGEGSGVKREPCFELVSNALEASILFRTDAVKRVGYRLGQGDEHASLLSQISVDTDEVEYWASYCYRWGCGEWHASGSLGKGTPEGQAAAWKERNLDVRPGRPLELVDMRPWWDRLEKAIPEAARHEWARKVGLAP